MYNYSYPKPGFGDFKTGPRYEGVCGLRGPDPDPVMGGRGRGVVFGVGRWGRPSEIFPNPS